jgi:thioredoxin reductase
MKIENSKREIVINENCSTNIKGVFAGGDAVNGGKEVVDAVEDGKAWGCSDFKISRHGVKPHPPSPSP